MHPDSVNIVKLDDVLEGSSFTVALARAFSLRYSLYQIKIIVSNQYE